MFIIMQYLLFIVLFLESWLLANTSPLPLGRLTDQLSGVYSMGLVNKRSGENLPETNKIVAPKFMMDLYSLIAFDNGDKKKGVLTNGNKIRCFLAGSSNDDEANQFQFNIDDISDDEAIIRAEFQIFKLRNPSNTTRQQFIRVEITNGLTRAVRLLNTLGSGWKSFQLTGAVKLWRKGPKKGDAIRIKIKTTSLNSDNMRFADLRSTSRAPFLVVFSQKNPSQRAAYDDSRVTDKSTRDTSVKIGTASLPLQYNQDGVEFFRQGRSFRSKRAHSQPCKRKSMIVDMKTIGWDRYILAPSTFNAYRCEGKCRGFMSKAVAKQTHHSVIQALLSQLGIKINGRPVRPPCCAPSQFESKTLLVHRIVKQQSIITMEEFYDIAIKSCACL